MHSEENIAEKEAARPDILSIMKATCGIWGWGNLVGTGTSVANFERLRDYGTLRENLPE